jgi:uncharacterized membrane protein
VDLTSNLLPPTWYWLSLLVLGGLLAWCAATAPWHRLRESSFSHAWLGGIVTLFVLWSMSAGVDPGLGFHLLGASACTLMFGPQLALIAMSLVAVLAAVAGTLEAWSIPINVLVMGAVPIGISLIVLRAIERWLPSHFFVYIFGNAFFGAALAMVCTGVMASLLLVGADAYSLEYLRSEYLPWFVLMSWAEAFTTGAAVTLLVVYRPHWVSTFDDRRYLIGK